MGKLIRKLRYPLALAISAGIFLASSRATVPLPPFPGSDKVAHIATYFTLGLSYINVATVGFQQTQIPRLFIAWFATTLFGLSDEWHQAFVPGRQSDLMDVVADGFGAALAVFFVVAIWQRGKPQQQTNHDT